jgi:hypothetical protein
MTVVVVLANSYPNFWRVDDIFMITAHVDEFRITLKGDTIKIWGICSREY